MSDDNPRPARLQHPEPSTPAGRGLLLVEALAEQWGQRRPNHGKTVWARLALPPDLYWLTAVPSPFPEPDRHLA